MFILVSASHCIRDCALSSRIRHARAILDCWDSLGILNGPGGNGGGQRHRVRDPEAAWTKGLLVEAGTGGLSLTEGFVHT